MLRGGLLQCNYFCRVLVGAVHTSSSIAFRALGTRQMALVLWAYVIWFDFILSGSYSILLFLGTITLGN